MISCEKCRFIFYEYEKFNECRLYPPKNINGIKDAVWPNISTSNKHLHWCHKFKKVSLWVRLTEKLKNIQK